MLEILITGIVVFIAVIVAGFVLLRIFKLSGNNTAGLEALQRENADQKSQLSATDADLRNANVRIEELKREAQDKDRQIKELTNERDDLDRRVVRDKAELQALEARLNDLREAKERMALEFKEVAGELMQSHSKTFKMQNKEQIDELLRPLNKDIKEFKEGVTKAHEESLRQHSALDKHIETLNERSVELSKGTENLTNALKGDSKLQGNWGQHVLEKILQSSGLREGEEYTREETHYDDDNNQVRPDFIVTLPNGDRVIIDSKVSIKHYELATNTESLEEREQFLSEHTRSVRKHIKDLGGKDYHKKAGSRLDFVIMFMPIEPALGAAFQRDDKIGYFAAENKVSIATPTTLMAVLKTIASIWRVERQNKFAEQIASRAGSLYDKFCGFLSDLENVGAAIDKANGAYHEACKKLSTGRGNLVNQTKQLENLGAKITKTIPEKWIEEDETILETDSAIMIEASAENDSERV